jgi:hypothetical protein
MWGILKGIQSGLQAVFNAEPERPTLRAEIGRRFLGVPKRRNIVFIGLTQNGKSTVIKSILSYSGDNEQATGIKKGDGNDSMTQDVSDYKVTVPVMTHSLIGKETGVSIDPMEAEPEDEDDMEVKDNVLEGSIPLTLIDTPGLSDTSKKKQKDASGKDIVLSPKIDDLHRLQVIKALADAGTIHSICLVIQKGWGFGGDFQKHISQYLDIFRVSNILDGLNFHVLHTAITPEDHAAGSEWKLTRQKEFEDTVCIKATHHWMDNDPLRDSPIAEYFSKDATAKLIRALRQDDYVRIKRLEYPKTARHKVLDNGIRAAYNFLITSHEAEQRILRSELDSRFGLENKVKEIRAPLAGLQREKEALESKADKFDKDDLVVIGGDTAKKYKESVWHNPAPTLRWRLNTAVPIKLTVKEPEFPSNGYWVVHSSSDTHLNIDYEANALHDASASVVLKGSTRDVHADDISRYRRQAKEFGAKIDKIIQTAKPIEDEIRSKTGKIAAIEDEIVALRKDAEKTKRASFPLEKGKMKGAYFLAEGVYSIALTYGLSAKVDPSRLPNHSITNVSAAMWTLKRTATRQLTEARLEHETLKSKCLQLSDRVKTLQADAAALVQKMGLLEEAMANLEAWQASDDEEQVLDEGYFSPDSDDSSTMASFPFQKSSDGAEQQILDEYQACATSLSTTNMGLATWTKEHAMVLNELKVFQQTAMVARLEAQAEAAQKVLDILGSSHVPMPAFCVLHAAFVLKDPAPYTRLYEQLAESLLLANDIV